MNNKINLTKLMSLLAAACFASASTVFALDPPPDGGYANQNTAEGQDALLNLTTGQSNTALGFQTLMNNRKGSGNTAVGATTLESLSSGGNNTAVGLGALADATRTDSNTAVGSYALNRTTTGYSNTAVGFTALSANSTGYRNTASGMNTLSTNTTGTNNTGYGYGSLLNVTTGSNNTALGANAGWEVKGSNNIDIGANGLYTDSNTIRIGESDTQQTTYIAGITGATVPDGVAVVVGAGGHLGTTTSSARYKEAIKPMDKSSEAILSLQPVTFRYKKELDPAGIRQFGLVAEEVAKIDPNLIARDESGKPYTVRYEAVNAMLLNEFLKEHRKGEAQEQTIAKLKAQVAQQQLDFQTAISHLQSTLKEHAAQIQTVSAQLAAGKAVPRLVVNDP